MKTSLRWQAGSAVVALMGLTIGPLAVAEIDITPRLEVRQSWTDTANLDAFGSGNGDYITTISPGFQANGTTSRVQAFIDYTLNGLVFWKNSGESDIRHQLAASVNTEVVNDRFFIDLRGSVQQQFQDFTGQVTNVNENFTQNRATVQNYTVTPRWREEIGNLAVAELSYSYSLTKFGDEGALNNSQFGFGSDAIGHLGRFNVQSGSRFSRFTWNWNTNYNIVDRDVQNFRFESFESIFDATYNLNRTVALVGSIGYENIRDDTLFARQTGVVWDAGLRVRPGPRTNIEARIGRRFNDWVYSGNASYAFSNKDTLAISYSEDLTVANGNGFGLFPDLIDSDNDGSFDQPVVPDPIVGEDAFFTDAAFRQKRASLTLSRQLRQTSLSAQGFWEQREFSEFENIESYGGSLTGQYRISGPHSLNGQLVFRHNRFGANQTDDFASFSPAYTYTFNRSVNATARYNLTKRFSNIPGLERTTNTVSISVTALF